MESLFDQLTDNPIILAAVVVLALLIIFSFVKRLIRLALFVGAVLILYVAYLIWTGQDIPTSAEDLKETFEKGKEVVSKKIESFGEGLKEKAGEAVKDAILGED